MYSVKCITRAHQSVLTLKRQKTHLKDKSQVDERVAARKRRYVQKFKKAEKKYKR